MVYGRRVYRPRVFLVPELFISWHTLLYEWSAANSKSWNTQPRFGRLIHDIMRIHFCVLQKSIRRALQALIPATTSILLLRFFKVKDVKFERISVSERLPSGCSAHTPHGLSTHLLLLLYQCGSFIICCRETDVKSAWIRFMTVVSRCLLRMYQT